MSAVRQMLSSGSARVLVGVSGGMDSVVLLHAFTRIRKELDAPVWLAAAHVNYGLRGEASDADEAFVREICRRWSVPLAVRRVRSDTPGSNRQAWARRVRYQWFRTLASRHGFSHVAVAHHRDDQAETVLLKLLRGAGPDRLIGMKSVRPLGSAVVLRPFLGLSRAELNAYAERHRLEWREDVSNASDAYDRTHVRSLLERLGGSASVVRTVRLLDRQYTDLIGPQLKAVWQRAVDGDRLLLEPLRNVHPTLRDMVLTDALRDLLGVRPTEARIEQVQRLVDAQKGKRVTFKGGVVWREHNALRFVRQPQRRPQASTVRPSRWAMWGAFCVDASEPVSRPELLSTDPSNAWVAADAPWPLTVRRWKAGDTLRTMGGQTKLVSDALTEGRIPTSERAEWPVVCAGDTIVWVPGVRRASSWLVDAGAPAVRLTWREGDS